MVTDYMQEEEGPWTMMIQLNVFFYEHLKISVIESAIH